MKRSWPVVRLGEVLIEQKLRIGSFDADSLPLLGVSNTRGLHRPVESPAGEAFGAEPKALPIIGQQFECRAGAVTKDVDGAAQGILAQHLATQSGEAIDPLPEVDRLQREKDATLGRELEHQRLSRKVWSSGASAGEASV